MIHKKSVAKIAKIETDWSFEEAPITEARIGRRSGGSKVQHQLQPRRRRRTE